MVTQKLDQPTAPFYIGKGKAEHVAEQCQKEQVTSVIFDDELSPAQGRNLEKLTSRKVLDRTQLILDIFAQRARSREGRLQIELAQLQYLLPRLTGMWTHLSRQSGGIGTRGPGETQLEVDRRRVQERIAKLETGPDRCAQAPVDPAGGTTTASLAGGVAGGVHQCGKIDAAQPADWLGGAGGGPTLCDAGPNDAPIHAAE